MNGLGTLFAVLIEDQGWRFAAPASTTLMAAARLAGITLPSACRNGTCRTCLCQLRSGAVQYQIDWPGLTAEEKKQGLILPCVAQPFSDLVFSEPRAVRIAG